ncbi:MAG: M23 family metallopeptidase [Anaerolineae bacterium]
MRLILAAFFAFFTLQFPTDLHSALTDRLDAFNAIDGNPIEYRTLGQTANADGAILYLQPISRATGDAYPGIVDWGVAVRQAGGWVIALPGDSNYTALTSALPSDVMSRADSTPYTILADPALDADLSGYQFPWADGAWATVTRSYARHGIGRIDFDLSAREVAAAKDGVILYANDSHSVNAYASDAWWYWNTIVIQHGDHEYSLYGHLAPGSIPQWIKDDCADDLSAANCAVPVKAGQVIALEGSSGFSSNPHLHAEFGQAFGVAAYMDTADEDGDGVRAEPVYAGYVYAEHNVGFSGYAPDEAAEWAFGTLQQATHGDPLPVSVNLIVNGDFSAGTDGWTPSGQINWSVQDGVMRFTRLRTTEPPDWAAFYQTVEHGVAAHTPFQATLKLGNASGIAKTVTVSVFNRSGRQYGLIECAFSIPPNTPLQQYTMRGAAVNTWASLRFEIGVNPPDGAPAALVDDISLQVMSDATEEQCITPT